MIHSYPSTTDPFSKPPLWPPESDALAKLAQLKPVTYKWNDEADIISKDPRQVEIEFFFPLTEQIPLDLDFSYNETNTCSLKVHQANSVGDLRIGCIDISLEKEPKWYQKLIYKLLGFNWKKN